MYIPTDILAVGIDPAKIEHQGVALMYPEVLVFKKRFKNTIEEISAFDNEVIAIAKEHNLKVVYGLEDSGIYGKGLKDVLTSRGHEILEVNPVKTNRQRDFYGEDNSDEIAAKAIAAIVLRSKEKLPKVKRGDETINTIREVSRERGRLVKNKVQNINRLHFFLTKVYLSSYKEFFKNLDGKVALEFFSSFPIPQALKDLTEEGLSEFFYACCKKRFRKRAKKILNAVGVLREKECLPQDKYLGSVIKGLAMMIKDAKEVIEGCERYLEQLLLRLPSKLTTFKGMDVVLASVIIGETRDISRFKDRNAYAKYNGTGATQDSSGKRKKWIATKWLKVAFYQLSLSSLRLSPISKWYYKGLIKRGLNKQEALKRLSRRLSDIIFAMLRDNSKYDPSRFLKREEQGGNCKENSYTVKEPCITPLANYNLNEKFFKKRC